MSTTTPTIADTRRREMAVEHLLFQTIRFVARQSPQLLDELERSVEHLWDRDVADRDDDALRDVARRFLASLRHEA